MVPDHRVKFLQSRLQSLVAAHQAALFADVGNVSFIREEILETIESLGSLLSGTVDADRYEIVKLIGQREDADSRREDIDRLKSNPEVDASGFDEDQAELSRIDNQIKDLKKELAVLQGRRTRIVSTLKQRQTLRLKRNKQLGIELKRLQSLPTREVLGESIQRLQTKVAKDERELNALNDGGKLLADIIQELTTSESSVKTILVAPSVDISALLSVFTATIEKLEAWFHQVTDKEWRLIQVILEAELEGYRTAKDLVERPGAQNDAETVNGQTAE